MIKEATNNNYTKGWARGCVSELVCDRITMEQHDATCDCSIHYVLLIHDPVVSRGSLLF